MKRIALFCSAGMSTSLLVTKMKKAAKAKGIEVSIDAFPEAAMEKELDEVDVVLIGPQIKYLLNKLKKLCDEKGVPIAVINTMDYGMMDGDKVLEQALKIME
ncbi:PTS sugar transporter subunit IIB [Clostridium algidicarnis]|uniref:PTS system cellobiose-specific IIB component n=2 Tax=Clostridium algidicarnis TaxID=37659 RepID=A0A2S6FVJ7_9CLOT|nr:PTS sugar transporter subunit IIB [Clostridium algidicarnis]MBU3220003.1 PTS sugar transporter subunit IIB [Clostridium algidicarnis]MCB2287088.1 PTS sugar transporter subunit IIB [Clostridium algidicarnis]PPK46334.1 PTS system cellobiose-specific IIB component [Clostridium algidicarnis DSM 15099]